MEQRKRKAIKGLIISIVLMLVSMLGASLVQTSGGKVSVKELQWETSAGFKMSGLLFRPKDASIENPAPAVITCHGMYNNKEMQDINFTELSRRGYVVLAIDMFSHGNSENLESEDLLPMGVSEAVKLISGLGYVDQERIGVTGHSMGGMNCEVAAQMDEDFRISSILFNSCFATYRDGESGVFINAYGSRDVGIIAGQYDEFLFQEPDADGNMMPAKDFIKSENAQSFLNFGKTPSETREADVMYKEKVDGEETIRVIYNPPITHPWSHFSKRSAQATIEFFSESLGAPRSIAADNQIWQLKEVFNFLGLVGMAVFAVNFVLLMIHTPLFCILRRDEVAMPRIMMKKDRPWYWGSIAVNTAFGAAVFLPVLVGMRSSDNGKVYFAQNSTLGIGLWAALCGIVLILCMWVTYRRKDDAEKASITDSGIKISGTKLIKTIVLALLTAGLSYFWVFVADYFFQTDFRIWVLAAKTFEKEKVWIALFPNLILFLVYYISSAVSVNCFNYYGNSTGRSRGNIAVQAFAAVFPAVILVGIQYISLFSTGKVFFSENNTHSYILWLFPMIAMIPASVVIGRKVYQETGNPYLPGIINACLVTMISCANTVTWS